MNGTGWMQAAACRDYPLGLFFAADGETAPDREAREIRARAVCGGCPVRVQCLEYRLTSFAGQLDDAIWGGRDGQERASLRHAMLKRQRRAAA